MIPSARMVMLMFSREFCIICFSFYIYVCLLIAVGVWILFGSSWTMPGGKPQTAGRYPMYPSSAWVLSSCFMILLSLLPRHPAMVLLVMLHKICSIFYCPFCSLWLWKHYNLTLPTWKYVKHKRLKTQDIFFFTTVLLNAWFWLNVSNVDQFFLWLNVHIKALPH